MSLSVSRSNRVFTFTGSGFVPGEEVSAQIRSTVIDLPPTAADAHGTVVFTWTAPASFPAGPHQIHMTAPSGTVSGSFTVPETFTPKAPTGGVALPDPPLLPILLFLVVGTAGVLLGFYRQLLPQKDRS